MPVNPRSSATSAKSGPSEDIPSDSEDIGAKTANDSAGEDSLLVVLLICTNVAAAFGDKLRLLAPLATEELARSRKETLVGVRNCEVPKAF